MCLASVDELAVQETNQELQCVSLSEMIHAVPWLLETMPASCLASLAATNSALRNMIHAFATVLYEEHHKSVIHLRIGSWPAYASVVSQHYTPAQVLLSIH